MWKGFLYALTDCFYMPALRQYYDDYAHFLEKRLRNRKMVELALNRCSQEENTPSVKEAADANKDN